MGWLIKTIRKMCVCVCVVESSDGSDHVEWTQEGFSLGAKS